MNPQEPRFRQHARRQVRMKANVVSSRAGWERDARVQNLGFGGACIEIGEALTPGDRVTVSFVTPNLWDPLLISAVVCWVKPGPGMEPGRAGLKFEFSHSATVFALFELLGTLDFET
jgi:hypothetical protein